MTTITNSSDNLETISISTDDKTSFDLGSYSLNSMGASGTIATGGYFSTNSSYGNVTINSNGTGSYNYPTNPTIYTTNNTGNTLHVRGPAEFEGDVMVKGRSLEKMFQKIEDRLAILQEPSPEKLEKYAALKKAYEHYKTLERLIGEDE